MTTNKSFSIKHKIYSSKVQAFIHSLRSVGTVISNTGIRILSFRAEFLKLELALCSKVSIRLLKHSLRQDGRFLAIVFHPQLVPQHT